MKNDTRSSDERQRQLDEARDQRRRPETEQALRQFLKLESGAGNSSAFQRGWTMNFEWTQEDRDAYSTLLNEGVPDFVAFERVQKARSND